MVFNPHITQTVSLTDGNAGTVQGYFVPVLLYGATGFLARMLTRMHALWCGVMTALPLYVVMLLVMVTNWSEVASQERAILLAMLWIPVAASPGFLGALCAQAIHSNR
jgi:hypothetical protein